MLQLAAGLAIGALSHYRFIAVIGVGMLALLSLPRGREVLRDPRVWIAIAFGASAWAPLMAWNMENAEAGLRFQLVDRHPWAFHADGIWFLAVQGLLVTPPLFVALLSAATVRRQAAQDGLRYLARAGGLVILGFFVLGFFADTQRVSFHWPLPGYLALLPLLPALLQTWSPWLRRATWVVMAAGLMAGLGYFAAVSSHGIREKAAVSKWYPSNFAGWDELADAVRLRRDAMPTDTRIVADNFKVGAELGFALGDPGFHVLHHPLNVAHGRAPQLRLWGLLDADRRAWGDGPVLLVVGATDVSYKDLLQRYHALCDMIGPLPAPGVVNIDHGRQRFLMFEFEKRDSARMEGSQTCTTPAMAWIDTPVSGADVSGIVDIEGWAFKDGVGIERVDVLLDGRPLARAEYGVRSPGVAKYWKISTDPRHPDVGFRARLDVSAATPGVHWLGLRLHGRDGSVENWSEQPIVIP